jgi:phosphoadenosine phosphosulfate reductase
MQTVSQSLDLAELNAMFEKASPQKVVEWAIAQWGDEVVMSSSFGAESALMIHLAIQHKPDIKVIFVDTGYQFPETFRHMEDLRRRFDLNVWTYRTRNDPIQYLKDAGETDPNDRKDDKACCAVNKTEPFERAMRELAPKAWIRGIRRQQAETRTGARFVEWASWPQSPNSTTERFGCYAVSPLLNMSTRDIFQYMKAHNLPYHPLYEQGYSSIGCNPLSCTRAVQAGEDARSGRWAGKGKIECGLHAGSLDSSQL